MIESNFSTIDKILGRLKSIYYKGLVVIKSTILPHKLKAFDCLNIVVNPEFLNAKTAVQDFKNQDFIILVANKKALNYAAIKSV